GREPLGTTAGVGAGGRLDAQVLRTEGGSREGMLHALSARGQRLGETPFKLEAGETRALATFDLPLELRNQVTRVEIAGERSAAAVNLLDARSQWHRWAWCRAPRVSRPNRCWLPSTTSSGRCSPSRNSPKARTPISTPRWKP